MRRKKNTLVPFEIEIIEIARFLKNDGYEEFYGFQMAKQLGLHVVKKGALYRALMRLEKMGYLESKWEDQSFVQDNRPRRRYYKLKETK